MKPAYDAPKRPALRYYGGKWNLAPWIISHFPAHNQYLEPCGGAASVLLQKPRANLETYNDLDGAVVNFFRVLRNRGDELLEKIRLTPYARAEFELSWEPAADPIEAARRFFCLCWMTLDGAANDKTGTTWQIRKSSGGRRLYHDELIKISSRLLRVQIENKPALEVIEKYQHEDTLIYFDPPYLKQTRSHRNTYTIEGSEALHVDAAQLLRDGPGMVLVSGYACPLYTDLYESRGWPRFDKESLNNAGSKRIESLWISPRTWEKLQEESIRPTQMGFNLE